MPELINRFKWYPPAETKIPFLSLLYAALPLAADFKKELRNCLGIENCVLGISGRALLFLLLNNLRKYDTEHRDEVLIPGYTCYSVAASVARAGLRIKVYDLDPKTFNPDMDSIRCNINKKTLAIISQHLFGIPIPIKELQDIAQKNHITHIEDAAQGLGGTLAGQPLGVTGDFGLFSFGRGKPLPLGCGGALIGFDKSVIEKIHIERKAKGYKQLTVTACTRILSHPLIYCFLEALPLGLGETIFDPGFTVSSMPDAVNRLGTRTYGLLKDLNAHRHTIAKIYSDNLSKDLTIPVSNDSNPVYTRFPVMVSGQDIPKTLKSLGVRRMYPNAIIEAPAIRPYLADHNQTTPGAVTIAKELATLPTHKNISPKTAEDIASQILLYV